jgi:ribose transport system ATP-binding protein
MSTPFLELSGVVKTFPGVRALDGVDLDIVPGEVHCLLGQNGAGKSTLIKILSGAHQPDEGTLKLRGQEITFANPLAAMKAGIATIYQELDLVDDLSVAENIFLGHEPRRLGFVQRGDLRRRSATIMRRLGHPDIPVTRSVGKLATAAKQVVSMGRALSHEAQLIIMDEPSAVLAHDEVANLFRLIRDLTADGIAVLYISHRLDEIREIGDRVTVLKDGRTAATDLPARTTPHRDLVRRMTGRTIEYLIPPRERPLDEAAAPVLTVTNLTRYGEFEDVSLTVRSGEILGIAGLVGSGRSEVLETIYGARVAASGTVDVAGTAVKTVGSAVRAGVGLAPEERKSQALLLDEPIWRNVTLAALRHYSRLGFSNAGAETAAARDVTANLALHPADVRRRARTLSGGNQQKVVLARWLVGRDSTLKLLLLDEPTRGVDVGARTELYGLIRRLAERGVAVLLVSSEVPEVLGLADRVVVMREGRIVHEAPAADLDEDAVLDLVMAGSITAEPPAIG